MFIIQVVTIKMKPSAAAELPMQSHTTVADWLKVWTPRANFKAIICDTKEEGVEIAKNELMAHLVPDWLARCGVRPEHFTFEVAYTEVIDKRFWSSLSVVWCKDHSL